MTAPATELADLLGAIRACRQCVENPRGKTLPHEPRPVLRASGTARLAVCGQAPGTRVHASGTPFTDPSGDRLRAWMGVTEDEFYDESRLAIVPMGFCFPGQDAKGGDLPPRRECSTLWHRRLFDALPQIELVLAVGAYAQEFHLGASRGKTLARDNAALAGAPQGKAAPQNPAAAAPVLAQQCLADQESLVRSRAAAGAAARGAAAPVGSSLAGRRKII